ncbi:MAG: hypothetical protein II187_05640 [Treponema sp.]|nr:hypothetical protein [Treponema sp.]
MQKLLQVSVESGDNMQQKLPGTMRVTNAAPFNFPLPRIFYVGSRLLQLYKKAGFPRGAGPFPHCIKKQTVLL